MSRFMYDTWRLVFSVTLVATLYLTENGSAQDLDYTIDVLIDRESEDIDPEDIALLESLRREPLDINRARRTELEQLPWISPNLAQTIIAWRDRHGDFDRTGALLRVPGVTYALITRIEPFVHVTGKRVLRTRGRWRVAQSRTDRPDLTGIGILGIQADLELGGWIDLGGQAERRSRAGEYKWRSGYVELVQVDVPPAGSSSVATKWISARDWYGAAVRYVHLPPASAPRLKEETGDCGPYARPMSTARCTGRPLSTNAEGLP